MTKIESFLCPKCERYLKPARKGLECRYCGLKYNRWGKEGTEVSYRNYKPYEKYVFKANEYLTLKLEHDQTYIYVKGVRFLQCIRLVLDIQKKNIRDYDEIDSIDEAADVFKQSLWLNRIVEGPGARPSRFHNDTITPEQEFWGHCSNIQAWVEHDYDTRILYRNMAFPLLRELTIHGDPKAKRVFKEEIAMRFASGHPTVMQYLINEGYLTHLDPEEFDTLIENGQVLDFFIENGRFDLLMRHTKGRKSAKIIIQKLMSQNSGKLERTFASIKRYSASLLSSGLTAIVEEFDNEQLKAEDADKVKQLFKEYFIPNLLDSDKAQLMNHPHSLLHDYYIKIRDLVVELIDGDTLQFKGVNPIIFKNLHLIQNPERIRKLHIDSVRNLKILSLNCLTHLEELSLQYNELSTIEGIQKLKNITKLELQGNAISDISCLSSFEHLTHLNLENNQISDYRGLEKIQNLTHINLAHNKISKLRDLSTLTNLRSLNLSHNNIHKLDCATLPKSAHIDLTQNPILQIKNRTNKFSISCAVTFNISLVLIEEKILIHIKHKPVVFLKNGKVYINQGGFWYTSEKVGKDLPGFSSIEEVSLGNADTVIEVDEIYFSKFSDYAFDDSSLEADFKELYYTLQSWMRRNYSTHILQKRIALPLLKELKNAKNAIDPSKEIDNSIHDYVKVPFERLDRNNEPVREFKTYKIIKKLEF